MMKLRLKLIKLFEFSELWAGSLNAEQWWSSTIHFGRSCAVMSVIGYIIGLGDRHLDNVLVDLRCGEVTNQEIFSETEFKTTICETRSSTSIIMFASKKVVNFAFQRMSHLE